MTNPALARGKNALTVAQAIVEQLEGINPDQQALAIRYAAETLGLSASLSHGNTSSVRHPDASPGQVIIPPKEQRGDQDIRSFTREKAPDSDQQFCAVAAYFYRFVSPEHERAETISAKTMEDAARLAGRKQVKRWSMTLHNAKNAGYLDAVGSGQFKLSAVGENLVAVTLPGTATPPVKGKQSKKKVAKRK